MLLIRSALHTPVAPTRTTTAPAPTTSAEPPQETTAATTGSAGPEPTARFYVVQEGDTLESISAEHDTTVERLLELNPGIDPVALTIGQRIRIG